MQTIPGTPRHGVNRAVISGRTGLLRSGSRVVTEFSVWTAEPVGDRLRVTVASHEPDPYWWEHHGGRGLVIELDLGRTPLRGPAAIVASDPLVIDFEEEA